MAVVGVRDVSVSVAEGEIFCIMGLSGSGKSTLVRHVNRLIEPTAGEILINGTDVGSLDPEELRALRADRAWCSRTWRCSRTAPCGTTSPSRSSYRNVDAFTRAKVANETIELVGLEGYGDRMPSELSGGMQQRVGLARAMAANPDILLMDPFSALDPLIRRNLQDEFLELLEVDEEDDPLHHPRPRRGHSDGLADRHHEGWRDRADGNPGGDRHRARRRLRRRLRGRYLQAEARL